MTIGRSVPMTILPRRNIITYTHMMVTHAGMLCFSHFSARGFTSMVINPAIITISTSEDRIYNIERIDAIRRSIKIFFVHMMRSLFIV
jgi:hypothetical protein